MKITHNLKIDLVRPEIVPPVAVVQGDTYTREIKIALYANGEAWELPEGHNVVIRYRKPDGTTGKYDTLPDNSTAWASDGNCVSVMLCPQMLTCPGKVPTQISIIVGEQVISTFTFVVDVAADPSKGAMQSENYINWRGAFLPQPTEAKVGQFFRVAAVDATGKVTTVEAVDFDAENGGDGRGIVSIVRTEGDGSPGTTDTYTINYTDGTTSTYTVHNGKDGTDSSDYVLTEADKAEIAARVVESLGGNPVFGYVDENNNIIVSGKLADGTYSVVYEMEDGSTVDIGQLVLAEDEPDQTYTNLADPTSADWQEGYRLSISSGTASELEGHTTTNYIPCKMGDVLRVKGMTIAGLNAVANSSSAKVVAYNASKTKLAGLFGVAAGTADTYGNKVSTNGDISTYTIMYNDLDAQVASSDVAYIRLDGALMDGYTANDVIITINEEIV